MLSMDWKDSAVSNALTQHVVSLAQPKYSQSKASA